MHIIQHASTGENSIKIPINTSSSKIQFNDSNYNNVTINLENSQNLKDQKHQFLLSISSFQIPVSWSLISEYYGNNKLEYIINGVTYNYTIPNGSYSANGLKSLLNSDTLLSVSYSQFTGKYTFSNSTYDFSITNNTTCYKELGFNNETYNSSSL